MYSPANRRFVFSIVRNHRVQVERATIDFSPSINLEVHPSDEQHRRDDLIYLFGVQLYGTDDDRHTELIRLNVFDPPHLLAAAPMGDGSGVSGHDSHCRVVTTTSEYCTGKRTDKPHLQGASLCAG